MSKQKPLSLSIIIPVYNEEDYLEACLQSIAAQSVLPEEVIIVDNNCTDSSMKIARRFSFVKIVAEPRPHQSFAQLKGFNSAKSDILGRIDADTILPADWAAHIKLAFAENPSAVAVSGGGVPYDMYAQKLTEFLLARFYEVAGFCAGHRMLWGSNCAIRRSAWLKVKNSMLLRSDIWEDYDLAFCLAKHGRIRALKNIQVSMSLRSGQKPFWTQINYQMRSVRTYRLRAGLLRAALFFTLWLAMLGVYVMAVVDRLIRFGQSFWTAQSPALGRTPKTDTTNNSRL